MQPIFLPFTYMTNDLADCIYKLFGTTIIYQPGGVPIPSELKALSAKGIIEIRIPAKIADNDTLAALIQDFDNWATCQGDRMKMDTKALGQILRTVPFYDENSIHRIRTELSHRRQGKSIEPQKDPIFAARLFLALAQQHDIHQLDLEKDLDSVAIMEKGMFEHLAGNVTADPSHKQVKPTMGEGSKAFMISQRIEAWSTLYGADKGIAELFLTDSRAVIDHLCDTADDLTCLAAFQQPASEQDDAEDTPAAVHDYQDRLTQLMQGADPLSLAHQLLPDGHSSDQIHQNSIHLSVYGVPGVSPDKFWQRYLDGGATVKKDRPEKRPDILNTLLLLIEMTPS